LKNSRIRVNSVDVPDTGGFSDHLPVLLDLETRDSPRSSSPQT
jgi:endonuclease/exonuclease/phosphatase family metal-dependent hydrolase